MGTVITFCTVSLGAFSGLWYFEVNGEIVIAVSGALIIAQLGLGTIVQRQNWH